VIRDSSSIGLVLLLAFLMSACGGDATLKPPVTPLAAQPSRAAEPNSTDVLAMVTPRPALAATPQPERFVSPVPPENVRQTWSEITSNIEGYHSPTCGVLGSNLGRADRYTCSSTVPLTAPYAVLLNQVGQALTDQRWLPTSERPMLEHGIYVWSFRRDGLACTFEVGPRGPAWAPPFVHVRVEALAE
jgi:hypothetical protein